MFNVKKYIKLIISILFVCIIASGVGGCMKENRIDIAQELLKAKYGEDFKMYTYGKSFGTLTNNTFTVVCSPVDEPELRFEAEIAKDGSYMIDEYVARKVSDKIEKKMMEVLNSSKIDISVKVGSGTKTIESSKSDMSAEEFIELMPNAKFAIYVVIGKTGLTSEEAFVITGLLNKSLILTPNINGYIYLYLGPTEMITRFNEYKQENPWADKGMFDILKDANSVEAEISKSVFNIKNDELMFQ